MRLRQEELAKESLKSNLPQFFIDQQLKEKYRNGNKTRRRIEKSLN